MAEYVADPNATQAAVRAGYSARTARQMGAENLSKPVISAALEEARAELAERAGVEAERIIEEFKRLAFSDLRDAVRWRGSEMVLRDSDDLTPDAARAIREVVETVTDREDGGQTVRRSVKLHDKLGALRDLARILGLYPNAERGSGINVNVNVDNRPGNPAKPLSEFTAEELNLYESLLAPDAPDPEPARRS